MTAATGKGTAMHIEFVRVRFESGCKPGPKLDAKLSGRVSEIRKLLRTDLSIPDIAVKLDVTDKTLRNFIKRRRLCNMKDRQNFITLQRSIAGEALE